ncbi:MAG: hypothetical protein Q8873_05505 [Bacillota bacterium]|nr:hypothetical protein [Bacillota bacterium]
MRLFINADRVYKTGWEGYDFVINRVFPTENKAVIEKSISGWEWKNIGTVNYTVSGNEMMISISRGMLGLNDKLIDIEFKWNDNMQNEGVMDFYTNGDTAPIGRYAYRHTETTENDTTPVNEPVTVTQLKRNQYSKSVI